MLILFLICWGKRCVLDTFVLEFIIHYYHMALSHKDWEQPNSRIWLAEIDIESGVDFPI